MRIFSKDTTLFSILIILGIILWCIFEVRIDLFSNTINACLLMIGFQLIFLGGYGLSRCLWKRSLSFWITPQANKYTHITVVGQDTIYVNGVKQELEKIK